MFYLLPLSSDPRQVLSLSLLLDGLPLYAEAELRCLPAPDGWVFSVRDAATGELLVSQIPLVCSSGEPNNLLSPFAYLRGGRGLGALYCLKAVEEPDTPDPAAATLGQFQLLWGDLHPEE